ADLIAYPKAATKF
nr:Chain E, artificial peptide [synthetic construct]1R5V_F Chain F, artificial peptide [synthetic construct]